MESTVRQAVEDAVEGRMRHFCIHVARCSCRSKLRMGVWQTLDALTNAGWQLVPPKETP